MPMIMNMQYEYAYEYEFNTTSKHIGRISFCQYIHRFYKKNICMHDIDYMNVMNVINRRNAFGSTGKNKDVNMNNKDEYDNNPQIYCGIH